MILIVHPTIALLALQHLSSKSLFTFQHNLYVLCVSVISFSARDSAHRVWWPSAGEDAQPLSPVRPAKDKVRKKGWRLSQLAPSILKSSKSSTSEPGSPLQQPHHPHTKRVSKTIAFHTPQERRRTPSFDEAEATAALTYSTSFPHLQEMRQMRAVHSATSVSMQKLRASDPDIQQQEYRHRRETRSVCQHTHSPNEMTFLIQAFLNCVANR